MGILAPLYLTHQDSKNVCVRTLREPLVYSVWLFFFSGVVFLMGLAITPLLRGFSMTNPSEDMGMISWIPLGLQGLAGLILFLGILLAGYRKEILLDISAHSLSVSQKFWGVVWTRVIFPLPQVKCLQIFNQTPKRYRPEEAMVKKNRPVGYWVLAAVLNNQGVHILDTAPREDEILEIAGHFKPHFETTRR